MKKPRRSDGVFSQPLREARLLRHRPEKITSAKQAASTATVGASTWRRGPFWRDPC